VYNHAQFQEAVDSQDYASLQDSIRDLPKKDALDHLTELFPHKARQWFNRNLGYLMQLDPIGLSRILGHSDPTADKAIRNIERSTAA
jgi:hypothetical protein